MSSKWKKTHFPQKHPLGCKCFVCKDDVELNKMPLCIAFNELHLQCKSRRVMYGKLYCMEGREIIKSCARRDME